jgi:hypothetical protein
VTRVLRESTILRRTRHTTASLFGAVFGELFERHGAVQNELSRAVGERLRVVQLDL